VGKSVPINRYSLPSTLLPLAHDIQHLLAPAASRLETGQELIPVRHQYDNLVLMAQRMQLGLWTYPFLWMLLTLQDGHLRRHLDAALAHGLALLTISGVRLVAHRRLLAFGPERVRLAQAAFSALSILHNLYWGALCAMLFVVAQRDSQAWMMMVATVGITAGGIVVTSSDPFLPRYYAMATLGPTALMLLPHASWTNVSILGMIVLVVAYSRSLAKIARRDHLLRIEAQLQLEQRAIELEALSRTDALTRIANRLAFEERYHAAWRQAVRRNEPLAIAIIDLDHFKRINDQHGHPFGDRCLIAAADVIREHAQRPGDQAARYGGEEFVLLMENTDLDGAMHVAQRLLATMCATRVHDELQQKTVPLSCSIGVASVAPVASDPPRALIQQADKALYEAKAAGRARVHPLPAAATPTCGNTPAPRQAAQV